MSINGPHAAAERLLSGANGGCPHSCEMTDVLCCFPQARQFSLVQFVLILLLTVRNGEWYRYVPSQLLSDVRIPSTVTH